MATPTPVNSLNFDTQRPNDFQTSLDSISIAEDQTSSHESYMSWLTLGTPDAVVSGVVGLYNTGVALGSSAGLWSDQNKVSERNAIQAVLGNENLAYYDKHKEGIDLGGFILSSIIPGTLAVKAFRSAMKFGAMTEGMSVATGLRNAQTYNAATEAALAAPKASLWTNPVIQSAYLQTTKQAFMEAAVFDAAVALTTNQNAAINREDLGYFNAAWKTAYDFAPYTVAAGGIGAALNVFRVKGILTRTVNKAYEGTDPLSSPIRSSLIGLAPGNAILTIAEDAAIHSQRLGELGEDAFKLKQFNTGKTTIEQTVQEQIGLLNAADAHVGDWLYNKFQQAVKGSKPDAEALDSVLAFAHSVEIPKPRDFKSARDYYTPDPATKATLRSPFGIVEAATPAELQSKMASTLSELGARLPEGTVVDSNNFIRLVNESILSAEVPSELRHSLIYRQLAEIKLSGSAEDIHLLDSVLKQELKTLSGQKISGLSRTAHLNDLLQLSKSLQPELWRGGEHVKTFKEAAEFFGGPIGNQLNLADLLATAGGALTSPVSREIVASKFPALAKYVEELGLADKPWNSAHAFHNLRTGETYTSALLGLQDVAGKISVGKNSLSHSGLAKTFEYDASRFALSDSVNGIGKLHGDTYLDYDAMWHIAATEAPTKVIEGLRVVGANDLPRLERLVVDWGKPANGIRYASYGERELNSLEEAKKLLLDEKFNRKVKMIQSGHNEQTIAKVLHMEVKDIHASVEIPDNLLMAQKDYGNVEVVKFNYLGRPPAESGKIAFVQSHLATIRKAEEQLANDAVVKALGQEFADTLPTLSRELRLDTVSPQNSRAGFLTAANPEFNSLREEATLVGKAVTKYSRDTAKAVQERFAGHIYTLNGKTLEAQELRAEFAKLTNLTRSGRYDVHEGNLVSSEAFEAADAALEGVVKTLVKEKQYALRLELESQGLNERQVASKLAKVKEEHYRVSEQQGIQELNAQYGEDYVLGIAKSLGSDHAPATVKMSPKMQDVVQHLKNEQESAWERSRELAKFRGHNSAAIPPRWIQPPQPDLKQYKFNAFVVPKEQMAGSDSRKFVIYAETEAEFDAKLAQSAEHFGEHYKIVSTKTDVALYKKMRNEYDSEEVFSTINFDSSQFRKGQTGEVLPNMDIATSESLNQWINLVNKRESAILKTAVEIRYRDKIEPLRRVDKAESRFAADTLGAKESDSIWKDTINMFTGSRSYNAGLEALYGKVSDFVGDKGSVFLDRAFNSIVKTKSKLTPENYAAYAESLEKLGYVSPLDNYFNVVARSPDVVASKTLSAALKTLSGLHSTFMLRLEPLNNMLQALSSPILTMPAIRELKSRLSVSDDPTKFILPTGETMESSGKLMSKAVAKLAFPDAEAVALREQLNKRGIIGDYIKEYHGATDLSELNGRHILATIDGAIEKIANFGGKYAGFNLAEEGSRFVAAHMAWQVGKAAGKTMDQMMPMLASVVDRSHGVYSEVGRAGLFRGVVGQGSGLYMTYFFNMMQQFGRGLASNDRKRAAIQMALQGSMFGLGSMPGMQYLNAKIAKDFGGEDIYDATGAYDGGWGEYLMYGLGSHTFGMNVDVFSRGNLQPRHTLVVPTNPADWAVVGRTASVVSNLVNMSGDIAGRIVTGEGPQVVDSLIQGLAHNGLYRPAQGLGALLAGEVTTKSGRVLGESRGFSEDIATSTWVARLLGSRPTSEGIMLDAMYRKTAYQAALHDNLKNIGGEIQQQLAGGEEVDYDHFARKYRAIGGNVEGFNRFWVGQMRSFDQPKLEAFKEKLQGGSDLGEVYREIQ